jgi:hypothetical protein
MKKEAPETEASDFSHGLPSGSLSETRSDLFQVQAASAAAFFFDPR